MTKEVKHTLMAEINDLCDKIDYLYSKLTALAGVDDDAFYATQKKYDKIVARFDGITFAVEAMGYKVVYNQDTKERSIVTEKQYLHIIGWDRL